MSDEFSQQIEPDYNFGDKLGEADLLAVRLHLRTYQETTLPINQERTTYQLFLALLGLVNPTLAEELEASEQSKPFTVSALYSPGAVQTRNHLIIGPETDCYIRFTGLNRAVVEAISHLPKHLPEELLLNEQHEFKVIGLDGSNNWRSRTGHTSYRQILEDSFYNLQGLPRNFFKFKFYSPTVFKVQGQELPLPLAELAFGSLLERWNKFATGPLAEDTRDFVAHSLRIGIYRLASHYVWLDNQTHFGFTGSVNYRVTSHDRFYLQTLNALGDFSFYAGMGYKTSAGLGQVRRVHSHPNLTTPDID